MHATYESTCRTLERFLHVYKFESQMETSLNSIVTNVGWELRSIVVFFFQGDC